MVTQRVRQTRVEISILRRGQFAVLWGLGLLDQCADWFNWKRINSREPINEQSLLTVFYIENDIPEHDRIIGMSCNFDNLYYFLCTIIWDFLFTTLSQKSTYTFCRQKMILIFITWVSYDILAVYLQTIVTSGLLLAFPILSKTLSTQQRCAN